MDKVEADALLDLLGEGWSRSWDRDAGGNPYDVLVWEEDSYRVVVGYGDTGDGEVWWLDVQVSTGRPGHAREWHTTHSDCAEGAEEIADLALAAAERPWRWDGPGEDE